MLNTPPSEILDRFAIYDEAGDPFPPEKLPGRLALQGIPTTDTVLRFHFRPTGEEKWSVVKSSPITDQQGHIQFVINLFQNITNFKQIEQSLHEQREWFQVTLAGIGDAVIATDVHERVVFINAVAAELTGWATEEALGQDVKNIFRAIEEDTRQPIDSLVHRAISEGSITMLSGHTLLLTKDGQECPIDDSSAPIRDKQGKIIGAVLVFRDITEQRKTQAVLQESEQRFRMMSDSAPVLMWMAGVDKLFTYFNQSWLEFTGRTADQEIGSGWFEGVHPDDTQRCMETYTTAFDRRERFMMEYRLRAADGSYRWLLDVGVPRFAADSTFEGYIGSCLDITERKRDEEMRQYLSALVNNSDDAITGKTLQGIIVSWNGGAERIYGYTAEEMVGQSVGLLFPPGYQNEHREILEKLQRGQHISRFETKRLRKDGAIIDMSVTISPIKDGNGTIIGASTIGRDITSRKRAQEQIRYQAHLLQNVSDAIVSTDMDRRIQTWNNAAEMIYGWIRNEVLGRLLGEVLADGLLDGDHLHDLLQQCMESGNWQGELVHRKKDGSTIDVSASASLLTDDAGQPTGFVMVYRDITERKRVEMLEREQRILAEALRDTANALNSTLNLSEVLDRILTNIERVVPHDAAEILLIEGKLARVVRSRGYGEYSAGEDIRLPISVTPHLRHMLETRQPLIIPDLVAYLQDPELDLWPETRWRSYAGTPIYLKDDIIGFINLDSMTPHFFTTMHADRLQAFAEQAAIAIQNARLYEQEQALAAIQERQRLARELHDAVSQTLFSASMIAEALPRQWDRNPEKTRQRLEQLHQLTRGALAEMRTLLLELRPNSLLEVELPDLLRQLAEAVQSRKRITITVKVEEHEQIPPDVKFALYRIAQEALNNTAKHARATQATIRLSQNGTNGIELSVADNGRGFDPGEVTPTSLGLGIMRERAEDIGAKLTVATVPGSGTQVTVSWTKNSTENTEESSSPSLFLLS